MTKKKSTKEQILLLKELQVLDLEIYELKSEKEKTPKFIKDIETSLESKKEGIKKADDDLRSLQIKLKEKEITLQQKEGQIKKLDSQLSQIKTNKEYSAMLREIEGIKADNSLIEEDILKTMDAIDASKKNVLEEKELFKKEEEDFKVKKEEVFKRDKEIDAKLKELLSRREVIAPNVESVILKHYEKVLDNRGGLAIVCVENGSCGGCHMNLPPQVVSEAKIKENIVSCGSCSRILYIDDDVEID
ncbi:MAG: C4-type zinc ribbon domain-containing protein [Candidatus Omnitrophota bacterium]